MSLHASHGACVRRRRHIIVHVQTARVELETTSAPSQISLAPDPWARPNERRHEELDLRKELRSTASERFSHDPALPALLHLSLRGDWLRLQTAG